MTPNATLEAQLDAISNLCSRLCLSFEFTWSWMDEVTREFQARLEAQQNCEPDHA